MVSGEESEEKQNVLTFLTSTAESNANLSQEEIDLLRVKFLTGKFTSKVRLLVNNLENTASMYNMNIFPGEFGQILMDTFEVMQSLKCFYGQNNIEQLNSLIIEVKTLLNSNNLFPNTVNGRNVAEFNISLNSNPEVALEKCVKKKKKAHISTKSNKKVSIIFLTSIFILGYYTNILTVYNI